MGLILPTVRGGFTPQHAAVYRHARGWDSRRVQAAITEATRSNPSVNAPTTTAPPAGQSLAEPAEPVRKKKKAMKRRATDPQPALPPTGKKPIRGV